jgi:hypothetical protein
MNITKLIVFFTIISVLAVGVYALGPSGASITPINNETAPEDTPLSHEAIAGNVTEVTITGFTTTQTWQGYYGNVSGTIQLTDSNDNVLYNWSLASPEGEVYSSTSNTVTWPTIDCFDMATDHPALETLFGIASDDVDGVNETFRFNNHPLFYTGSVDHTLGECNNTYLYNQSGQGAFYEVLLTDGTNVVFASILREETPQGFNGELQDFEMIVLENGHGTNIATTTYYFWVELE